MALALNFAARSDVGLLREGNEDSGYAGPRLLVVADGMGGHAAGEVASSVAVATLSALDEDSPGPQLLDRLKAAVDQANAHLRDMVEGDPALGGMGTTLTALLRAGNRFGLVHVGDSRCYLLRSGALQQITHDHTFVQSLVDEGRITLEEASHHPQRSLITNALDGRDGVEPDLSLREARAGDRWLLCSDGLSSVVSEQTLEETLRQGTPDDAADALVDLALRGGGPDNITVIVADVVDVDRVSPSDIPQVVGAAASGPVKYSRDERQHRSSAAARAAALSRQAAATAAAADEEEPAPRRRRFRWRWFGAAALLVVVAALAVTGISHWARGQYFVSAGDDQHVAIYQGLSQNVLGWEPSSVVEHEDITLDELSSYSRRLVEDSIPADDLAEAQVIVGRLEKEVEACRSAATSTPVASPTSTPAATPGATASGAATATATASASTTPPPTPAPTLTGDRACPEVP